MTIEERAKALLDEPFNTETDRNKPAYTTMSVRVLNSEFVLVAGPLLLAAVFLAPVALGMLLVLSPVWLWTLVVPGIVLAFIPPTERIIQRIYGSAWGMTKTSHRTGRLCRRALEASGALVALRTTRRGRKEARGYMSQIQVLNRQADNLMKTYDTLGLKRTMKPLKELSGPPERLAAGQALTDRWDAITLEMARMIVAMEALVEVEQEEKLVVAERKVLDELQGSFSDTLREEDRVRTRTLLETVEVRQGELRAFEAANEEIRKSLR